MKAISQLKRMMSSSSVFESSSSSSIHISATTNMSGRIVLMQLITDLYSSFNFAVCSETRLKLVEEGINSCDHTKEIIKKLGEHLYDFNSPCKCLIFYTFGFCL
jgi:hypothetical protein